MGILAQIVTVFKKCNVNIKSVVLAGGGET